MQVVRIGLVGVTGRGWGLGQHWKESKSGGRSAIVAGMDTEEEALSELRERLGPGIFATRNIDELLDRDDVDAVAVMSPDYTHEEYVLKAFRAGKHVFCEKPMAITTEGCDRMLEAWRESGKKFMIGFNMRYMNIYRMMKEVADSGVLGEIKAVWVRHFVGSGGDWYFHDWHSASKHSTGLLLQKASHDIDIVHWITGRYTKRVSAFGGLLYYGGKKPNDLRCRECADRETCYEKNYAEHQVNKRDLCAFREEIDVEDTSAVLMELDGGIQATYMQCHFAPETWRNYTFIGTEGRMENLDRSSKILVRLRRQSRRRMNTASDIHYDVRPAEGGHGGSDPLVAADMIDMLQKGKEPVATPLAGRMSVAAGVAATQSLRNGGQPADVSQLPDL